MTRLLVATNNPGKQREYQQLLAPLGLLLLTPQDLAQAPTVLESGRTYAENARLKALAYQRASGLLTLADDSGLEVDALDGEPGLYSARYAGPIADDTERYRLLLTRLEGVPWEQRTARFCCVVVLAAPGGATHSAEGICEGFIALQPRGHNGFGYDPVFYFPEHDCTMAQLPPELKNCISHRARAVQKMLPILHRILSQSDVSPEN
jgi:XTP/dITP diphosphohydrolase